MAHSAEGCAAGTKILNTMFITDPDDLFQDFHFICVDLIQLLFGIVHLNISPLQYVYQRMATKHIIAYYIYGSDAKQP